MDFESPAVIRPFSAEFADREIERKFAARCWPQAARQTHLAGLIGAVVYLLAACIDYAGLGLTATFYWLLALRAFVALSMVGFVGASVLLRSQRCTEIGVLLVEWLAVAGLLICATVKQQNGDFRATSIVSLVLIYYFLVPNRLPYAAAAAISSSLVYIAAILAFLPGAAVEAIFTALMLALANMLGFSFMNALNRARRRDFWSRRRDKQRNFQLHKEIQERRQREAELQEFRDRLQQQTTQLMAVSQGLEEAHAKAVRERTRATEANAAKSRFLANMSHELRTPLNAVIGFAQILRDEMLGPLGQGKYREYAGDIYDAGRHLLVLINDILDLAKVEAGKFELHPEAIEIPIFLRSLDRLIQVQAADAGIRLEVRVAPDLPLLNGDLRAVKQMLLNLLGNALKFTPRGGSISIDASVNDEGGVVIRVKDSGIGIAEKDQARIFDPFEQVDDSYTRQHDGTGLGLPLVKALIEQHGGTVRLESELGGGTCVSLTFPPADAMQILGTASNLPQKRVSGGY